MGSCNVIKSSDVHCSKQQCRRLTLATSTIFSLKIKFLWNILGKTGIETGQLGPEAQTLTTVLCRPSSRSNSVCHLCFSSKLKTMTSWTSFHSTLHRACLKNEAAESSDWLHYELSLIRSLVFATETVSDEIKSGKQGENFPPRLVERRVNDCLWAVIRERSSQPDSKMRHPLTFWQRSAI